MSFIRYNCHEGGNLRIKNFTVSTEVTLLKAADLVVDDPSYFGEGTVEVYLV